MNDVEILLIKVLETHGRGVKRSDSRDPDSEEERKGEREHQFCWEGCAARKAWEHINLARVRDNLVKHHTEVLELDRSGS